MRVSDERLAEIREKHLRDAARLSRHDVLADPHRELAALLAELQEHRAREAASVWEYGLADPGATEPYTDYSTDRDWILDGVHPLDEGSVLLRRRAPGPWEPVTVGDDDD